MGNMNDKDKKYGQDKQTEAGQKDNLNKDKRNEQQSGQKYGQGKPFQNPQGIQDRR